MMVHVFLATTYYLFTEYLGELSTPHTTPPMTYTGRPLLARGDESFTQSPPNSIVECLQS